MNESKSNLVHQLQPPIDKLTDNDIEKAAKEILKNTIQYQPDDRPTMKQVMEQLSQLKEQILRTETFEVIVTEKHMLCGGEDCAVYLGQHVTTQQPVRAVRYTIETQDQGHVAAVENEYHLLKNVITPHKNVVRAYHSSKKEYEKDGKQMVDIWIIMEHCECGQLRDYAKGQELTVKQKLDLMIQAGRAICHLHERKPVSVVHRFINPASLLVSGCPDAPVIKLSYFFNATTVDEGDYPFSMLSYVGNLDYEAPELTPKDEYFTELMYDISVDVFALGISCLTLLEALKGSVATIPEGEYNTPK